MDTQSSLSHLPTIFLIEVAAVKTVLALILWYLLKIVRRRERTYWMAISGLLIVFTSILTFMTTNFAGIDLWVGTRLGLEEAFVWFLLFTLRLCEYRRMTSDQQPMRTDQLGIFICLNYTFLLIQWVGHYHNDFLF